MIRAWVKTSSMAVGSSRTTTAGFRAIILAIGDKTSLSKEVLKNRPLIEVAPFKFESVSFLGRYCKILFVQLRRFYQVPCLVCPLLIHIGFTRLQHRNEFSLQVNQPPDIIVFQSFTLWQHLSVPCNHRVCTSMNGSS